MGEEIKDIQENPLKSMIILAIPIIILLLFNESYSLFDTYFLSQLGNTIVIAFGYITQIFYFINRSGKGLGRGVSSIIARLIGAQDYENINNIAIHGVIIIVVVSIVSQIILALFSNQILGLFIPQELLSAIMIYLQCLFVFLVFIFLSEYLTEILNGEGKTRLSTRIMSFGVALNIILDYVLIFPCHLGVLGGSLGTCISYVVTTVLYIYIYLIRKNNLVQFRMADFSFDRSILREILANAIPIILDSLVATLSGLYLITALQNFAPPITVVAFILILRIQMFLFTPIQGFSRASNIVIGHLFGAKRFKDVQKQLNYSILLSFLIVGIVVIILTTGLNSILIFFTQQYEVIFEVRDILFIIIIDMVIFSVIFNSNQALVAIGRSPNTFYSVIIRFISLFIFVYLLCEMLKFGKIGVLMSLLLSDVVQAFYSYLSFRYHVSKEKDKPDDVTENTAPN